MTFTHFTIFSVLFFQSSVLCSHHFLSFIVMYFVFFYFSLCHLTSSFAIFCLHGMFSHSLYSIFLSLFSVCYVYHWCICTFQGLGWGKWECIFLKNALKKGGEFSYDLDIGYYKHVKKFSFLFIYCPPLPLISILEKCTFWNRYHFRYQRLRTCEENIFFQSLHTHTKDSTVFWDYKICQMFQSL